MEKAARPAGSMWISLPVYSFLEPVETAVSFYIRFEDDIKDIRD